MYIMVLFLHSVECSITLIIVVLEILEIMLVFGRSHDNVRVCVEVTEKSESCLAPLASSPSSPT